MNGKPILFALAAGAALLFASPVVRADPEFGSELNPFPKGLRTFAAEAGEIGQPSSRREQIGEGIVGVGYFLRDNLSINAELIGAGVAQQQNDAGLFNAQVLLRQSFWNTPCGSFFNDVGLGVSEANKRVPYNGTDFNFTIRTGIGWTHPLTRNVDVIVGARYFHLSNARQEGPLRNPSINGIEGYVGLLHAF